MDDAMVMTFGQAIEALKEGNKIARQGWNGKGMFLIYVPATLDCIFNVSTPYSKAGVEEATINAHIDMYTATGEFQPGWLASQTDVLADDWVIVE